MGYKNFLNSYVDETVLPGSGEKVKYSPITVGQLKQLLGQVDNNNIDDVLNDMIKKCVKTDINIDEMYINDRLFLLMQIRKASKGSKYSTTITCPECKSQFLNEVDLDKLPVKQKNKDLETKVKVNDNISVILRFNKVKDEQNVQKYLEEKEKEAKNKEVFAKTYDVLQSLAMIGTAIEAIISPDDTETDLSIAEKVEFLELLSEFEFDKINQWFKTNDFGLDITFKLKCPHCNYEETQFVPVAGFFE